MSDDSTMASTGSGSPSTLEDDSTPTENPLNATASTTLPPYVCCVVTDGVWTWFGAFLLFVILFIIATLKYCKKRMSKPRFMEKNRSLFVKHALEDDKGAISKIKHQPVQVPEFHAYYAKRRKHKVIDHMEFAKAATNIPRMSRRASRSYENANKIVKAQITAYDHNRVHLQCSVDPESDYINASYVKVDDDTWIVSQGPTEATVQDFWQMVWQERSDTIVMLTKTFEFVKVMCFQYFPLLPDKVERIGPFAIELLEEDTFASYSVRKLRLSRKDVSREIHHYHYTEWPAVSLPQPNALISFRRRLREDLDRVNADWENLNHCNGEDVGPPIIHCSDGGGRCGTFVAIDVNLKMAESKDEVDVFGTVRYLKEQRPGMVGTPEQYRFIYDVIEDYLRCGVTKISVKFLLDEMRRKSRRISGHNGNEYQNEYDVLCSLLPRFTIGDCAAGHRAENRHKNRNVLIVPPDNNRPYLTTFQDNDTTDYVNAVFVDGYRAHNEFICTEWPMDSTAANFWSLVYDHDVSAVVVLNDPKSHGYPRFWPTKESKETQMKFGPAFTVEVVGQTQKDRRYVIYDLKVHKLELAPHKKLNKDKIYSFVSKVMSPTKPVRLFHFLCWPEGIKVPNSTISLVELMFDVEKCRPKNVPSSVLVMSSDGVSRCGVYCAASSCIQQVLHKNEVDVFQAVKTCRRYRPQLVGNFTEYKYCYDVVLHYVLNYLRPTEY